MLFKCQPQDRHGFIVELESGFGNRTVDKVNLLIFIDLKRGLQHFGAHVHPTQLVNERSDVFAKATPPRAVAHKGPPCADAVV
jgi:hypothetical protein